MFRVWTAWDLDPTLLLGLALLWWLYGRGLLELWTRAGVDHGVSRSHAWAFLGAMAALLLALVSPLDGLAEDLSSAHMAQHMLLMLVAAPLLAMAAPLPALLWGLPPVARKMLAPAIQRLETLKWASYHAFQPLLAWWLFTGTLWIWHVPRLYQAALRSPVLHDLEHLSFLLTAYLFWRIVLDPAARSRMNRGAGVIYLFAACLQAGALGIFLTLSPSVWYPAYASRVAAWGLTPLEDQQLAGLIMWVPGCAIYAGAAAAVFAAWLREPGLADEGVRG